MSRNLRRGALILFLLVLGYFLSSGPALFCAQRRWVKTESVEAIYFSPHSPLFLATAIVPGGEWLVNQYLSFWSSLTPMPTPRADFP